MSRHFGFFAHHFAVGELHQKFNEGCGPYTWLGYCSSPKEFTLALKQNPEFTMIGSAVDNRSGESSSLFVTVKLNGMVLICDASSHRPPELPEGSAMVMITAKSFDEVNEIVFQNNPKTKEIERWLEHGSI